ncbi:MAG: ribonuclease [Rhodocyclaceae bacterium]|nr:ribonuclease [Rhodocyclaceae bacterium]
MKRVRSSTLLLGLLLGWVVPLYAQALIALQELPREAQQTLERIREGGPFPYRRDGIVFHNYERKLPERPEGYYREYTVPTPGEKTRGPRRLVCGGFSPQQPEVCYYTADHYRSFRKILP